MSTATELSGKKILVTGATGQIIGPAVIALSETNEVWALGRWSDAAAKERFESLGIRTVPWQMDEPRLDGVPTDFTHAIHAAPHRGDDGVWEAAISANCIAAGTLMTHCRDAEAFLFVSTMGVYSRISPEHPHSEDDPTEGYAPWNPLYPITKIAAEGAVRGFCSTLGLRTTIARMNVGMGPTGWGGMPIMYFKLMLAGEPILVPGDHENVLNPIHTDDITRQIPLLFDVAATPATVVNWAGDDSVTEPELIAHIAAITGVEANLVPSDLPTRSTFAANNARRLQLIGPCEVDWRDGVARTIEAHYPGSVESLQAH
jgi:nucleoside-diphosphate-sugar epimerase